MQNGSTIGCRLPVFSLNTTPVVDIQSGSSINLSVDNLADSTGDRCNWPKRNQQ